jgi:hypothetical protein
MDDKFFQYPVVNLKVKKNDITSLVIKMTNPETHEEFFLDLVSPTPSTALSENLRQVLIKNQLFNHMSVIVRNEHRDSIMIDIKNFTGFPDYVITTINDAFLKKKLYFDVAPFLAVGFNGDAIKYLCFTSIASQSNGGGRQTKVRRLHRRVTRRTRR